LGIAIFKITKPALFYTPAAFPDLFSTPSCHQNENPQNPVHFPQD
jgi:hypothetical protein